MQHSCSECGEPFVDIVAYEYHDCPQAEVCGYCFMRFDEPGHPNRPCEDTHMQLTGQTFQLIAEVLAYQRTAATVLTPDTVKGRAEEQARLKELDLTTYAFAGKLAETSPNFDRQRFIDAAGV